MMIYFEMMEPLRQLSDGDRGRLFLAMLEYGKEGVEPKFRGKLRITWDFVKPKLDRDREEYARTVQRRRYATACRERKRKGEPEIRFEDWLAAEEEREKGVVSHDANDDQWYPTATVTPTVTPTTTAAVTPTATATTTATPTATTKTTAATAAAATANAASASVAATAAQRELKKMGGMLGKGVVLLSDDQIGDLLDRMGLDAFDHYVEKLAEFIVTRDARVKGHYETILRWWRQDMGIEN